MALIGDVKHQQCPIRGTIVTGSGQFKNGNPECVLLLAFALRDTTGCTLERRMRNSQSAADEGQDTRLPSKARYPSRRKPDLPTFAAPCQAASEHLKPASTHGSQLRGTLRGDRLEFLLTSCILGWRCTAFWECVHRVLFCGPCPYLQRILLVHQRIHKGPKLQACTTFSFSFQLAAGGAHAA